MVSANLKAGTKLLITRPSDRDSPDITVMSADGRQLEYVLQRKGIVAEHGQDRRWNHELYAGSTVFEAGVPYLVKIYRVVEDEKMQLLHPTGAVLADIDRCVKNHGYGHPDVRHQFVYKGKIYSLDTHKTFTGTNLSCKLEGSAGEDVFFFSSVAFRKNRIGDLLVSQQVSLEDVPVMLAACLAYHEWLERRSLLIFGDKRFNLRVVA